MKSVSKILAVLLLLCILWPFGEFFVNQWRNPERLTLSETTTVCVFISNKIYITKGSIATLTDYLILNYADIASGEVVGLTRLFAQFPCTVFLRISNAPSVQVPQIVAVSAVLSRTVYVLLAFLAVAIFFMPFILVTKFWRSKSS